MKMKISVDVNEEFKTFVEEYQERKELETFDEAFGTLALVGVKRVRALDKGAEKEEQARRFKAGEIKTAPVFETRTNRFPELVKPPEPKEEKPKKEKAKKPDPEDPKPSKKSPTKEKAAKPPKSTLSNKVKAAKPAKKSEAKPKSIKVVKDEAPTQPSEVPAPKPSDDVLRVAEVEKWYAEQKASGAVVKATDIVRAFGWGFNRAKEFLDSKKAAA